MFCFIYLNGLYIKAKLIYYLCNVGVFSDALCDLVSVTTNKHACSYFFSIVRLYICVYFVSKLYFHKCSYML